MATLIYPGCPNLLPSAVHLPASCLVLSAPVEDALPSPPPVSSSCGTQAQTLRWAVLQHSEALLTFQRELDGENSHLLNNVCQVSAMFEIVGPPWHMEKRHFAEDH